MRSKPSPRAKAVPGQPRWRRVAQRTFPEFDAALAKAIKVESRARRANLQWPGCRYGTLRLVAAAQENAKPRARGILARRSTYDRGRRSVPSPERPCRVDRLQYQRIELRRPNARSCGAAEARSPGFVFTESRRRCGDLPPPSCSRPSSPKERPVDPGPHSSAPGKLARERACRGDEYMRTGGRCTSCTRASHPGPRGLRAVNQASSRSSFLPRSPRPMLCRRSYLETDWSRGSISSLNRLASTVETIKRSATAPKARKRKTAGGRALHDVAKAASRVYPRLTLSTSRGSVTSNGAHGDQRVSQSVAAIARLAATITRTFP
jgi:hypothetical protein